MTTPVKTQKGAKSGRRYFTLAEAERALPYVSRVVEDVVATYRKAMEQQQRMERTAEHDDDGDAETRLRREYDRLVQSLNGYVDELMAVGVELKDYDQGLIDFPAMHDGREVYLCWKAGEKKIGHWHEIDAGFGGRQPVEMLKTQEQAAG